jgi:lysophospholipase L1-like esterase
MQGRPPTLLTSVLATLGIAALLLALLEGGSRVVGRFRTGVWPVTRAEEGARFARTVASAYRPHPYLVIAGRPGARIGLAGHEIGFNSLGLRGPEVEVPKPPGRFRIVCEGGSSTFDLRAADDRSTWPARLQALLKPLDADVVNAGAQGWTTLESLVSLAVRDVDLAPDLVVVFAGINDLQPASHVPFTPDYSLGHADVLPRVTGVSADPLPWTARSVFIEALLRRLGPRGNGADRLAPAWAWRGGPRKDAIPDEAVRVFERNLRSTIALAGANGSRTLLVAQTVRMRAGFEAYDREYLESWAPGLTAGGYVSSLRRLNEAARRLGEGNGVSFLDPFASDDFTDADFGDPMHFSASGSDRFARMVAAAVRGLVPPSHAEGGR